MGESTPNDSFVERLDAALAAAHSGCRRTIRRFSTKKALYESAGRPQTGIFYWLMNRDLAWSVEPFWFEHYGRDVDHPTIWRKYIAKEVAEAFNAADALEDIEACEYALPRGRVVANEKFGLAGEPKFILLHGGDGPRSLTEVAHKFNVGLGVNCVARCHPHWTMMREDYERLCQILGVDLKLTFVSEFDGDAHADD